MASETLPCQRVVPLDVQDDDNGVKVEQSGRGVGCLLQQAMLQAQHEGGATAILQVSFAVTLSVIFLSVMLLVYVFVIHQAYIDPHTRTAVISTANLQYIITISGLLSTAVSRTVPAVVTVYAYHVAAVWLRSSEVSGSPNRPSPLQLVTLFLHVLATKGAHVEL